LFDERHNPDNGFACGGPVAEDRAKSGLFFVKSFTVKPIRTRSGTLRRAATVAKLDYYSLHYYLEDWPQDPKHHAIQNWNRSFKTYGQFYDWLFQLPQTRSMPIGSWKRPMPNNRVSGYALVDVAKHAKSGKWFSFDEGISISDSVILYWDSVLQNYFSIDYLNNTFRREMNYEQSSRLWPDVFPPRGPIPIKYSAQEIDSIRGERIRNFRNEDKEKYDELIKQYPNDSVKLKKMYLDDSIWIRRKDRSHGDAGLVKKSANSLARIFTSVEGLRYDTDFNVAFLDFVVGVQVPMDRFLYRIYFDIFYNTSVFGSNIVHNDRVTVSPVGVMDNLNFRSQNILMYDILVLGYRT
jgi:hypothetical protein